MRRLLRAIGDLIYRWRSPEARCRRYKRQAERAIDRYLRIRGVDQGDVAAGQWAGPRWGVDD